MARGRRTIAGTLVMTKFTTDILMRFLSSGATTDLSKDTTYMKIDQLPPFNLSLLFATEQGYASYQRILGLEFVTDGSVYSTQDYLSPSCGKPRPRARARPTLVAAACRPHSWSRWALVDR